MDAIKMAKLHDEATFLKKQEASNAILSTSMEWMAQVFFQKNSVCG